MKSAQIGGFYSLKSSADTGKDTGEDHAAVASCAEEHTVGGAFGSVAQMLAFLRESHHAGIDSHEHVVAGVSVGDREHVEVVDFLDMVFQGGSAVCYHRGI